MDQVSTFRMGLALVSLLRKETGKINLLCAMECSHILIMRLYKYLC